MRRMPRALATASVIGLAGVALLAFAEGQAWRASRADYPAPTERGSGPPDGDDVVLVLGYPGRKDGSPGILQRWRIRIAVRSAPAGALFVFTGGPVHRDAAEADVMAAHAERIGIPRERIVRETRATSTRENLSLSLPWLTHARTIRIASNTAHARRARQYLRELDPALWRRLRPTRDFVPLELGPLRLALTFYDFVAGRVATRSEAARGASRPD